MLFNIIISLLCLMFFSVPCSYAKPKAADLVTDGQVIDLGQEKFLKLFAELREKHHFTQQDLDAVFNDVTILRRVLVLMDKQWEAKPYYKYHPLFITPSVIKEGKKQLLKHKDLLERIEKEIGVDRETVIAIWAIESRFGKHRGRYEVFRTLVTLFDAYPRRSKFFRKQLIHFLLLCKENQYDPLEIKGSYAGAFGQTQFIPSSFREYSVDFDKDGRRDVFASVPDILASIANYLRRYHWTLDAPVYVELGGELKNIELIKANIKGRRGRVNWGTVQDAQGVTAVSPVKNKKVSIVGLEVDPKLGGGFRYVAGYPNFQAITKWNHSNRYAMAVSELAESLSR